MSPYANDTTLMVEEDLESIIKIIQVLKWFKSISGLDINKEKTKVVKIGAQEAAASPGRGNLDLICQQLLKF